MGEPDQPGDVLQNKKCNFSIYKSEMLHYCYVAMKKTTKDMTENTHLFHWKYCINHYLISIYIKLTQQNQTFSGFQMDWTSSKSKWQFSDWRQSMSPWWFWASILWHSRVRRIQPPFSYQRFKLFLSLRIYKYLITHAHSSLCIQFKSLIEIFLVRLCQLK